MKMITPLLFVFISLSYYGCKTNSITGRSQLDLVPEPEVQSIALTQRIDDIKKAMPEALKYYNGSKH